MRSPITKPLNGRGLSLNHTASATDFYIEPTAYDYHRRMGALLRWFRVEAGYTQQEIGDVLGVTNGYISQVESGRHAMSPDHWPTLAKLYKLDEADFGKRLLRVSNPIVHGMIFGADKALREELAGLPPQTSPLKGRRSGPKADRRSARE